MKNLRGYASNGGFSAGRTERAVYLYDAAGTEDAAYPLSELWERRGERAP